MKPKPLSVALIALFAFPILYQGLERLPQTTPAGLRDSISDEFQNVRESLHIPRQSSSDKEQNAAPRSQAGEASTGDFSPVIAPSARELILKFEGDQTIAARNSSGKNLREAIAQELDEMMRKLSNPETLALYDIDPRSSEELGVLQQGMDVEILSAVKEEKVGSFYDDYRIRFKATARALVHKNAARAWLGKGKVFVYTRGKRGAPEWLIATKPLRPEKNLALEAEIGVEPALTPAGLARYENQSVQLSAIRGDNGNEELFAIYAAQGFDADPLKKRDYGWRVFRSINRFLLENGFKQETIMDDPDEKRFAFTKKIKTPSGRTLVMRFNHLAADSEPDSGSETFSVFMKEAVKNGDVILYGGHSGYGINLSLKTLNSSLRDFGHARLSFPDDKKQLYFFDTCYGYKYNSQAYREISRRKNADVVTYGLMSDFIGADAVWKELLAVLMDPGEDPSWIQLLDRMEKAQKGQTYLLNVGGL